MKPKIWIVYKDIKMGGGTTTQIKTILVNLFWGKAFLEQYLYINPEKKLLILRFGGENKNQTKVFEDFIQKLGRIL